MKKHDQAISYYNRILAINSTNTDAMNAIANDLDNLQRYDEAIQFYEKVLAIDPTNAMAIEGRSNDIDIMKTWNDDARHVDTSSNKEEEEL